MKYNFSSTIAFLTIALVFCSFSKGEMMNPLRSQGDYNAIFFGNLEKKGGGGDTHGYLAVQGDLTVQGSFGVGNAHGGVPNKPTAGLVVGGTLTTDSWWELQGGVNAYYGNSTSTVANGLPFHFQNNQGTRLQNNPVDFGALKREIDRLSSVMASKEAGYTASDIHGAPWQAGLRVGGGEQIVNINLAEYFGIYNSTTFTGLNIFGQADTTLIINIFGDDLYNEISFKNGMNVYGMDYENLFFNLVSIDVMTIEHNVRGNFIGTETDLVMKGNTFIDGIGVFRNGEMNANSEFHHDGGYGPGITVPQIATPEPASVLIIGFGLLGYPAWRRLSRNRRSL